MSAQGKPLYLHRSRFVNHNPSSITALAFSHPCTEANFKRQIPSTLRLAIGKTNGDIEIWRPLISTDKKPSSIGKNVHSASFFCETSLKGGKDRGIEGLAWTQDPFAEGGRLRLFSIGYSTAVTEWDLATGKAKAHLECSGGAMWSIAAQPAVVGGKSDEEEYSQLAVGMEDGSIQLVSTKDGEMTFVKSLKTSGKKARVLSLAWQGRERIVSGMANSMIKIWDARSGRVEERMSLGKEITKGKDVLIWTVKVAASGDIISGDSNGEVLVWSGKNYTLKQRLKSHDADILTLELNAAGTRLFTAGIDMKTVVHSLVETEGRKRWGEIFSRRYHSHDVRAMTAYEALDFSYVVSGGVDMTPILLPIRYLNSEPYKRLPALPQVPICATVPEQRLLLSHYEHELKIWKISNLDDVFRADDDLDLDDDSRGRELQSRIVLNDEENITTSAISSAYGEGAGNLLAVGTLGALKLFYLRPSKANKSALRVTKVDVPSTFNIIKAKSPKIKKSTADPMDSDSDSDKEQDEENDSDSEDSDDEDELELEESGVKLVKFSPDGRWLLVITSDSRVFLLELVVELDESLRATVIFAPDAIELPRVPHVEPPRKQKLIKHEGVLPQDFRRSIRLAEFNFDSTLVAVTDLAGWTDIYQHDVHWQTTPSSSKFPRLPVPAAAMHFRTPTPTSPSTDSLLLAIHSPQSLLEFQALKGTLTPWSRRNPSERFPAAYTRIEDIPTGIFTESATENELDKDRVWVWGINWLFMFDFKHDLPFSRSTEQRQKLKEIRAGKKRSAGGELINTTTTTNNNNNNNATERKAIEAIKTCSKSPKKKTKDADSDIEMTSSDHSDHENSDVEAEEAEDVDAEAIGSPSHQLLSTTPSTTTDKTNKPPRLHRTTFWFTEKYSNLLGVLPIGKSWSRNGNDDDKAVVRLDGSEDEREEGFREIVVVERPYWEVPVGPRYYGKNSWEHR